MVSWTSKHLTSDINKQQYFFLACLWAYLGEQSPSLPEGKIYYTYCFFHLQSWLLHHKRKLDWSDISPSYGWADYNPILFASLGIQRIKTHPDTIFCLKCAAAQIVCAIPLLDSSLTFVSKWVFGAFLALIRNFTILMGNYKRLTMFTHRKNPSLYPINFRIFPWNSLVELCKRNSYKDRVLKLRRQNK